MLNWLFGKKAPADPPTAKQLNYARKLGLSVPEGASRTEVSALLSNAEAANPKRARQREHVKEKQRAKLETPELKQQEAYWNDLGDRDKWLIAVYKSGKNVKGDVLRVCGADIDEKGKLIIQLEAGKIVRQKDVGEFIEDGRSLELDASRILWCQVVDDFDSFDEIDRYRKSKQMAENEARKFS